MAIDHVILRDVDEVALTETFWGEGGGTVIKNEEKFKAYQSHDI